MVKPSHSVFDSAITYLVVTVQIKVTEQYFLMGNSVEGDRGEGAKLAEQGMGGVWEVREEEGSRRERETLCNIVQYFAIE